MAEAATPAARDRAAANWHRAVESVARSRGKALAPCPGPAGVAAAKEAGARLGHAHDAAGARDAPTPAEAAQLFGASSANSAPSIIQGAQAHGAAVSKPDKAVRVALLVGSAHGVPEECRTYVKVAIGSTTHETHFITGVTSPHFAQLFTFDIPDPEGEAIVFKVKHDRQFSPANPTLGRATLQLSEVVAHPELYAAPHRLALSTDGVNVIRPPPGVARELKVQVFLASHRELVALAGSRDAALSVLAATWNVGNALPPPPEQLRELWLRGTGDAAEHHLVVVSAQECNYTKSSRQVRASSNGGAPQLVRESSAQRADSSQVGDGDTDGNLSTQPSAKSVGTAQAAAAVAAHEAPDTAPDEDDDTLDRAAAGGEAANAQLGPRQRMSRTKSLKVIIKQNIDSGSEWEAHIAKALGPRYWMVGAEHMFQTRMLLFARMDVVPFIQDVWCSYEATGLGRVGLNKGGVVFSLRVGSHHLAFVGSHLAAHQSECGRRNKDVAEIIKEVGSPSLGKCNIVNGPHHVLWMGDLNYRIDWGQQAATLSESPTPEDHAAIVALVQAQDYAPLLATDQLAREMREGRVFSGFVEAPVAFPPTFKVVKGEPGLVYGLKRSPAWCDRVLVRSNLPNKAAVLGAYYCCPDIATSDHKPVAAAMQLPMVTPPALVHERRKPFRLYICSMRLVGEGTWQALERLVDDRPLAHTGSKLRLLVWGPALAGSHKGQLVCLGSERLAAGWSTLATSLVTVGSAEQEGLSKEEVAEAEAARNASLLRGEASMQLLPTCQTLLKDEKLLLRLAVKEGPFHKHTVATAVLPLCFAVEDFAARRFKPTPLELPLETQDGRRIGALAVEAQIFSSVRTRSIVADAVRRMKLLAAVKRHHTVVASRGASVSATQAKAAAPLAASLPPRSASHV